MSNLLVKALVRVFVFNGMRLPDPDPTMSPAKVKDFFAAMYPELINAEVLGPVEKTGELEFEFRRSTGTKGKGKGHANVEGPQPPFAKSLAESAREAALLPAEGIESQAHALHELMMRRGVPLRLPSEAIPLLP